MATATNPRYRRSEPIMGGNASGGSGPVAVINTQDSMDRLNRQRNKTGRISGRLARMRSGRARQQAAAARARG